MSAVSTTSGNFAKNGGAKTGIDFSVLGIELNVDAAITAVLKIKEPRKTWGFLCDLVSGRFEMTERVAKHRLAATRAYTGAEIRALIQSEDGFEILQALMADAEPKWWWWAKRVMATAERRRQAAELDQEILKLETSRPAETGSRRRIKGDMDAGKNLGAKFARAETAIGFLAQNQDRPLARTAPHAKTKAAGMRGR